MDSSRWLRRARLGAALAAVPAMLALAPAHGSRHVADAAAPVADAVAPVADGAAPVADGAAPVADAAAPVADAAAPVADGAAPVADAAAPVAVPAAAGVAVEPNRRYARAPAATLDVYRPPQRARGRPAPAVLVVHGGAWSGGGRAAVAPLAAALAQAGFVSFNVDYPLSRPWLPSFPRALQVLRAAVRWIGANARAYGVDRERIGVLGTSAGGHLGALLAVDRRPRSRVRAAVLWSAPLDLVRLAPTVLRPPIRQLLGCRLGACRGLWRAASPVSHVDGDEPPILIVSSRREIVPVAQAQAMAARLEAFGSPHELLLLEGARHARMYADVALGPSLEFLQRRLARPGGRRAR